MRLLSPACALLVTAVACLAGCRPSRPPGPRAVFPVLSVQTAPVLAGESTTLTIPVRNEGSAPLRLLEVRGDCGCIRAEAPPEVAPGAQAELKVEFRPAPVWGGEMDKNVHVTTDDPGQPSATIALKATVIPLVALSPAGPLIVPFDRGKEERRVLTLTPRGGVAVRFGAPPPAGGVIRGRLLPPDPADPPGARRLEVRVGPIRAPGDFHGTLLVPTTEPKVPRFPITVIAQARSGVVVTPNPVRVPMFSGGPGSEVARMQVFTRRGPLKLLAVETGDPALAAEIRTRSPDQFHEVLLRYRGGWKKGTLRRPLLVRTDDPRDPEVRIPLEVTVN